MPCLTAPDRAAPCQATPCFALPHVLSIPNQLAPVRGNDAIAQSRRDHAAMPEIRTQHMTTAAQCTQVAQFVSGELAGSDMVNMGRLNGYRDMAMNTHETVALQNGEACLLPYLARLSSFGHCESLAILNFARPFPASQDCASLHCTSQDRTRPVLAAQCSGHESLAGLHHAVQNPSTPDAARLDNALPDQHLTALLSYFKRGNLKPAHADFAPAADTAQPSTVDNRCFHFVTADDGLIPQDREFTRPARRAGSAVADIAPFRALIDHAAYIKIYRRFRVSRRRIGGCNVEGLTVRKSRPVTVDQNDRIDDLQRGDHVRLNRSASALRVPCTFADDGEGIGCIDEQLTVSRNTDGLAELFGIIARYSRTFFLFERKCIRPESMMKHRLYAANTNLRSQNVAHAKPVLSSPFSTPPVRSELHRSQLRYAGLHQVDRGADSKSPPSSVLSSRCLGGWRYRKTAAICRQTKTPRPPKQVSLS